MLYLTQTQKTAFHKLLQLRDIHELEFKVARYRNLILNAHTEHQIEVAEYFLKQAERQLTFARFDEFNRQFDMDTEF